MPKKRLEAEPTSMTPLPGGGSGIPEDSRLGARNHLLLVRRALRDFVSADEETQTMVRAVLQEGLESRYLSTMNLNDRKRFEVLREQADGANRALSDLAGEEISVLQLYQKQVKDNPDMFIPLDKPDGLRCFFDFYKGLASELMALPVVTSEMADVKEQMQLVPIREALRRLILDEQEQTAHTLVRHGETLKEAAKLQGEIAGARRRGVIRAVVGVAPDAGETLAEIPGAAIRGFLRPIGEWYMQETQIAVSATVGAVGGEVVIFTAAIPQVEAYLAQHFVSGVALGAFGGAMAGIAVWFTLRGIGSAIGGIPAVAKLFPPKIK